MKDSRSIRFLDKYLGILICSVFSLINKFRFKKDVKHIRNVLIIEIFEMGASIMSYPSIKYIKEKLNNPNIYCLCLEKVKDPWGLSDIIPEKNIITINGTNLFTFVKSLIKQIIFLRRKDLDLVIDLELFTRISSIISFLVKSKLRAGFYKYELDGLYRGDFYDFRCSFNQNSHISKNFLALTKTAVNHASYNPNYKSKIRTSEIILPSYESDPVLRMEVKKKIKKFYPYRYDSIILISPDVGRTLPIRNYPKDYFVKVIKKLLRNYSDHLILLIGTKENWQVCSFIADEVDNKRCINFCNQTTTLKELVELMSFSKLLICNDNGPIHFASLTPINTLALFSTDSPFMYGALGKCVVLYSFFHCSPCICAFNHKDSRCKDNLCLKSISPDKVFNFSVKIMNDELAYRTVNGGIRYI